MLSFYDSVNGSSCALCLAFLKALFLTALALGNRCAELAHFSRQATVDTGSSLTFGLKQRFLYKNQASGRTPPPISVPLFRANPTLCLVVTFCIYLVRTKYPCTSMLPHHDFVFVHPSSSASLVAGRLNYWVVQAISAANIRGAVICAHDVYLNCVPYLRLLYLLLSSHYTALRTRLVPYPSHKRSCAFAWVTFRLFVPIVSALLVCASARCSSRARARLDLVYTFFYQTVTSRYF